MLIPDFQGVAGPLEDVLDAGPDVLNHNTETVPRLYRIARAGGRYPRTLELLDRARRYAPHIPTKSGLMVGLGEDRDELVATLRGVCDGDTVVTRELFGPLLHHLITRRREDDAARRLAACLTPRERQVLLLLAKGADTRGIARALRITTDTARTHVRNLLAKLGVHSRLEAAALVVRAGLVAEFEGDASGEDELDACL